MVMHILGVVFIFFLSASAGLCVALGSKNEMYGLATFLTLILLAHL